VSFALSYQIEMVWMLERKQSRWPNELRVSRRLEWTTAIDQESTLTASRIQNRPDPAGRLHTRVGRHSAICRLRAACASHSPTRPHPAQPAVISSTVRIEPYPVQRAAIGTTRRIEPHPSITGRPHNGRSYHTPHNGQSAQRARVPHVAQRAVARRRPAQRAFQICPEPRPAKGRPTTSPQPPNVLRFSCRQGAAKCVKIARISCAEGGQLQAPVGRQRDARRRG
jgi:hypothetical protein